MAGKTIKYVIYGSMGIADHIWDAILKVGGEVVAVVDSSSGGFLRDQPVKDQHYLKGISFDLIVVATMDYMTAIEDIKGAGYSNYINRVVFWEPFFLQIEPTTKCNFNCINCTRNQLDPCRVDRNMSIGEFENILDLYPSLKRVQLQGLGEPLMNPDIYKMVEICKSKGISVSITTNGSLLTKKALESLVPNLDKIVISIDGTDEESFGETRATKVWEKLLKNIQLAGKYKDSMKVVYNSVIGASNFMRAEDIVDFAHKLPPSELHFQMVENWCIPGQDGFVEGVSVVKDATGAVSSMENSLDKWRVYLKDKKISLTFTDLSLRNGKCWWPFYGMFVSVDSFTTPCCIRMQPEIWSFGKLDSDTWNGMKYRNFRASHFESDSLNKVCQNCPF